MFKEVVFLVLLIFVAWILIFQLLVPFFQGKPFFPFFRAKEIRDLEGQIADVRQEIEADVLKDKLTKMKPPALPPVQGENTNAS